jgi:hypothetical protein
MNSRIGETDMTDTLKTVQALVEALQIAQGMLRNHRWGAMSDDRVDAAVVAGGALIAQMQRDAVQPGWKLAPVEPTDDMFHAAEKNATRVAVEARRRGSDDTEPGYCSTYRAMLAAAPHPEAQALDSAHHEGCTCENYACRFQRDDTKQALDSQLQQPAGHSTPCVEAASTAPLPCPFCGDEPIAGEFDVQCYNAFCEVQPWAAGQSLAEAVAGWNRRSAAGAQQQDDHAGSPAPSESALAHELWAMAQGPCSVEEATAAMAQRIAQSSKAALSDEYRFGDGLEQAAFEMWAINEGLAYRDYQHGVCFYDVGGKAWAWRAWLARAGITPQAGKESGDA